MSQQPDLKLHIFFATENPRAVILRQGPSKLFRMILWHRDTNRCDLGQWLKHRVYADRCDLSPDGRHFLYFALDAKWASRAKGSYTAISQPPYFTALILHPQGDTWGGGGAFLSNKEYCVNGCAEANIMDHSTRLARRERGSANPHPLPVNATVARQQHRIDRIAELGYRTEGARLYLASDDTLIGDFTDMSFEPIAAPYSLSERWHPLDRDMR